MESQNWSLRLALALAVATALWVGAVELTNRVVAGRAGNPEAVAHATASAGMHAAAPAAR